MCYQAKQQSDTLENEKKQRVHVYRVISAPAFLSSSFKICFLFTNVIKGTPPQLCPALSVNDERGRRLGIALAPGNPSISRAAAPAAFIA